MKHLFSTGFLAMVLTGVATSAGTPTPPEPPAPTQSYNDIVSQREQNDLHVVIRIVRPGELRNTCRPIGAYEGKAACASYDPTTNNCVIYTLAPSDVSDRWAFEAIGHYLWHCRSGAFHKD